MRTLPRDIGTETEMEFLILDMEVIGILLLSVEDKRVELAACHSHSGHCPRLSHCIGSLTEKVTGPKLLLAAKNYCHLPVNPNH